MIRGLLHGIKRFWSRRVLTRRPSCHRKRGGFMGRAGIDLFIEDGAYTTLSSAVVILVVLTLLFSSTAAIWSMSRAGDTQVAADSGALAGANVVSSYHTAATVVDASILSLGLAGFATIGTGLVAILIPGAEPVAGNMVDTGIEIIKTRNKFAKSASEGLQKIETALPYLIAARATQAVSAQDTDSVTYTGTALAVPRTSESDFVALEGSEISTDAIKDTSKDLERAADELQKALEETAKAKERAWLADCGGSVPASVGSCSCMWERTRSLAKLSGEQNPHYASSISWEPQVALDRAKTYYRQRLADEKPQGSSVETKAESAARKAFYTYASTEVNRAYVTEDGDEVASYIPLLPRNTDEVRATELYTDTVWPTSAIDGKTYLHYGTSCPNYKKGAPCGLASVAAYDGQDKCNRCHFGVSSLGAVAAPSTSIENGFEYHFDRFKEALEDYVECRNKELELERQTEDEADRAGNAFDQAIKALSGERPRIAPPGRNGVVAFAVSGDITSPDQLNSSFNAAVRLGDRGAISAAVLAPDEATAQNNVLSRFFSTLKERSGGVAGVLDGVMDVWGRLLVGYGDIQGSADELMDEMIKDLGGGSGALGSIASWLGDTVSASVAALGLEPCDLRLRKPVLTDTANVIKSPGSDIAGISKTQDILRKIPLGVTDPKALCEALEYHVERTISSAVFTLAEIPLPGGRSIPLTVDVATLVGAFGGGS
ncbi:hypothetical protein [Collinsella aerofaciens]|uniref:hypothetical protein n=1 Tax=Collinsella aerofaciens TaxID=74426 RepID=UPI001E327AD8|nr:hypothetical protein [Collinsella aerofaciens]